jgi:hypothetical protein
MPCWVNSLRLSSSVVAHKRVPIEEVSRTLLSFLRLILLNYSATFLWLIQKVMLPKNGEGRQCSIISWLIRYNNFNSAICHQLFYSPAMVTHWGLYEIFTCLELSLCWPMLLAYVLLYSSEITEISLHWRAHVQQICVRKLDIIYFRHYVL